MKKFNIQHLPFFVIASALAARGNPGANQKINDFWTNLDCRAWWLAVTGER